jgi:hypothetical protein
MDSEIKQLRQQKITTVMLVRHVRDVDGSLNTGPASAGLLVLPQSRPDEVS